MGGAGDSMAAWVFQRNGKSRRISVQGAVTVNTAGLAVHAAVDGLGIAYATEAQAESFIRSGDLVRVLEDWSPSYEGTFFTIQDTVRSRRRCARSST